MIFYNDKLTYTKPTLNTILLFFNKFQHDHHEEVRINNNLFELLKL